MKPIVKSRPFALGASDPTAFATRILMPLGLFGAAVLVAATAQPASLSRLQYLLPVLALFPCSIMLSARVINIENDFVEFCWFGSWRIVRYDEIASAQRSWIPTLGVLRLSTKTWPFRRMYFVLGGQYDRAEGALAILRGRIVGAATSPVTLVRPSSRWNLVPIVVACWIGQVFFRLSGPGGPSSAFAPEPLWHWLLVAQLALASVPLVVALPITLLASAVALRSPARWLIWPLFAAVSGVHLALWLSH